MRMEIIRAAVTVQVTVIVLIVAAEEESSKSKSRRVLGVCLYSCREKRGHGPFSSKP